LGYKKNYLTGPRLILPWEPAHDTQRNPDKTHIKHTLRAIRSLVSDKQFTVGRRLVGWVRSPTFGKENHFWMHNNQIE